MSVIELRKSFQSLWPLTLYLTETPFYTFKYYMYIFGNVMENRAFAPLSNCSILHNIFKSIQNFTFNLLFIYFFNIV